MNQGAKIGCAIAGGLVLAYVGWVNVPRVQHRSELDKIYQAREAEFDENQKLYATDLANNGYLDPTFLELWARKQDYTSGVVKHGDITKTMEILAQFDPVGNRIPYKDLDKSVKENTRVPDPVAAFEKSKKEFANLAPGLTATFNKPVFLCPGEKLDANRDEPNFIGLRRACQLLAFQAHQDLENHKPQEALKESIAILNIGKNVGRGGVLIELMIGKALQNIGLEALREVLTSSTPLDAAAFTQTLRSLQDLEPQHEELLRAVEADATMIKNSLAWYRGFDHPTTPDAFGRAFDAVMYASGLVAREGRLWENDEYQLLSTVREDRLGEMGWLSTITWADEVMGRHAAYFTPLLTPNLTRARLVLNYLTAKMRALEIVAALQVYHVKQHHYPTNLTELAMSPFPQNPLGKPFAYTLERGKPQLLIPIESKDAESLGLPVATSGNPGFDYKDGAVRVFNP